MTNKKKPLFYPKASLYCCYALSLFLYCISISKKIAPPSKPVMNKYHIASNFLSINFELKMTMIEKMII